MLHNNTLSSSAIIRFTPVLYKTKYLTYRLFTLVNVRILIKSNVLTSDDTCFKSGAEMFVCERKADMCTGSKVVLLLNQCALDSTDTLHSFRNMKLQFRGGEILLI